MCRFPHIHSPSRSHKHTPSRTLSLRLTAPTKPQCILGTIKETGDHRNGQRTQTQGERRRARAIEIDDREGGGRIDTFSECGHFSGLLHNDCDVFAAIYGKPQ